MTVLYREHFGLKEAPFSIAPDPRYLFMSEQHREALAHLTFGITSDGGFVLLTGDVGTGKTTVSRCMLNQLPPDTDLAFVLNPRLTVEELLAVMCDELSIAYPEGNTSNKVFIDRINSYLLEAYARGRRTVLIIEEAQNLSPEVLEQLRLLTNLETSECKLLQIILLGQPELRDMLAKPSMSQLEQRVTARYHLGPLSGQEVASYVSHRLSISGTEREIFPLSLMKDIHQLSRGVPRLINLICDRALLGAYSQGKDRIDRATLSKAAAEVFGRKESSSDRQRKRTIGLAAAGLLVLSAVLYLAFHSYSGRQKAGQLMLQETAQQAAPQPPVSDNKWPADLAMQQNEGPALQEVFRQWGISLQAAGRDQACRQAIRDGLQCLSGVSDMKRLLALNRPSLLKLFDDSGNPFYVVLSSVAGGKATVVINNRKVAIDISEIEKRWLGDYTLLWRVPPAYRSRIRPGEAGDHVRWLAQIISKKSGRSSLAGKQRYDAELLMEVRRFQMEEGLAPDGIVGVHTVIHLNSRFSADEPLLQRPAKGI